MEKTQITQENDLITIGNVILTKDAISTLDDFQQDSNACIKEYLEVLGSAVCFLGKTQIHWAGQFVTESESLITKLSFIHGSLQDLKKPLESEAPSKIQEMGKRDWETK